VYEFDRDNDYNAGITFILLIERCSMALFNQMIQTNPDNPAIVCTIRELQRVISWRMRNNSYELIPVQRLLHWFHSTHCALESVRLQS